jgi:hypothetical protein
MSSRKGVSLVGIAVIVVAVALLLDAGAFLRAQRLSSVFERIGSLWRDDSPANAELAAFGRALGPEVNGTQVRQILSRYPQLSLRVDGSARWRVATPGRLFADNWVAWLFFRPDGRLLAVKFGTVDFAGPVDRPNGLPDDLCLGARDECARATPG